ncbi:DUF4249 domain-containing protein [Hymenobacter roseosalivarius]|uniref:DUF4249 domain-containing protein n=1 Tax=Hymenobacter roseosalivarius TaxID=89967 RepID=UPI0013566E61|nr:DUF4249 domain-containing protein [Hymenobacter roseosalivarius]
MKNILTRGMWRLLALVLLLGAVSCENLQQDIDVVIPTAPAQLVVECYLEPNQRAQLTVSETAPYLSSPIPVVPSDVTVVISGPNRQRETLLYNPGFNFITGKVYTHSSRSRLLIRPGDVFTLEAKDTKGRIVTGTAKMPATVPLDTVEFNFNDRPVQQREAIVLGRFRDPLATLDFYRFQIHRDSISQNPEVDYSIEDRLNEGKEITLGTSYEFISGDLLIVTLFHLDQPYYRFLQSTQNARNANGNPFAQPAAIQSTVQGGIGVFTILSYQRRSLVIR